MNHDRPRLPTRSSVHRATAATLRLWRLGECTDAAILTRVAAGLRALPGHPQHTDSGGSTTSSHEMDCSTSHLPNTLGDAQHRYPPTAQDNR